MVDSSAQIMLVTMTSESYT